ncbi:agaphelin-like [Aphomia sociella]
MDYKVLFCLAIAVSCIYAEPEPSTSSCACPKIYTPVCASNGKTYNSICEFRCDLKQLGSGAEIHIVRNGRCNGE